ncbi:YegS/Rv2252/BmrU family lipid kinase [Subsaximicrobium wynnwilliamsii]|uniref:YegS/Rv2252/BmrU family lipid kinase n=1 Tax=Subsaximicrobium wynnwilliamsii TaxID=291179 RepID=A0A5C6ZKQ3_9FLAO|nr:YegS/Rv2252/BmrU family lipid kinase [Subsaximicrobium wynnwilliamsii]TXD81572.1 YegS/Rv2252/BmrU family lipid kinase [Subsaximicrobium wynnwilliamsii]TXD89934.1 YegS/Rv2252/BmrU family lipid kinase [Subsaximicrobium wynnwilliamsii]TXE01033.1 YegS/Rv2252/BmrU family lipid kinase [Subsaximicrobium wynnwilliamsii]
MSAKSNILLVVNPKAGSMDVDLVRSKMSEITSKQKLSFETFETTGNNDKEQLSKKVEHSQFSRVIAAGGDGTINLVASVIVNTEVSLGILACGSANGLARNLDIPNDLEQQIHKAIAINTTKMDVLMVNGVLCMHIAGLGLNAELIRNYSNSKIRGKLGYALGSIPTLLKSDYPYNFEIVINGKSENHQGVLLAIANAADYGTGATINANAILNDGKFEVVLFKAFNLYQIFKTFSSNPKIESEHAETYSVTTVQINCSKAMALQVDGEFIGETTTVKAHILHRALKLASMDTA